MFDVCCHWHICCMHCSRGNLISHVYFFHTVVVFFVSCHHTVTYSPGNISSNSTIWQSSAPHDSRCFSVFRVFLCQRPHSYIFFFHILQPLSKKIQIPTISNWTWVQQVLVKLFEQMSRCTGQKVQTSGTDVLAGFINKDLCETTRIGISNRY